MASSSSSASSSGAKKKAKKKKEKKEGKEEKKAKKEAKQQKKQLQRVERARLWDCDRADAVRLLGQLLDMGPDVVEELRGVFTAIDGGSTVSTEGLEDKRVKKKLRHLLQAFRLKPAEGQGFCTADKKVSFEAVFDACLGKARAARGGVEVLDAPEPPAPLEPAAAAEPPSPEAPAEAPPEAPKPRIVGPRLPMPSVGGGVGGDEEEEEDDDEDKAKGPKLEGAERRGVDLDSLFEAAQREEWMTKPHESLAGAFGDEMKRKDRFEVRRSKKEEEDFEASMKSRGKSLLQQTMEGGFPAEGQEAAAEIHKRQKTAQGSWGTPAKQEGPSHRPFDPEQDLTVRKPMTSADFSTLVENSAAGLVGRFSRGHVAASFL